MKKNRGITLIALVITIIILIILAGISIALALGENGIIEKAKHTKEQTTIQSIQEKLEIVKGSDYIKQLGNITIDTYFETLEKEKIEPYIVTNKEKFTDSMGNIQVDNKYSFLIIIENSKNIEIEYEGKVEEIVREESIVDIIISGEKEKTTLPIKLEAIVTSNGENIKQPKWILNTSNEEIGTEESLYTQTEEKIELEFNEVNSYYIHTLTTDKYGRKKETIKGPITVTAQYHTHTGSSSSGGECYTSPNMIQVQNGTTQQRVVCGYVNKTSTSDGSVFDQCSGCGKKWTADTGPSTHYKEVTVPVYTTVQSGWKLNCGNTTSTIESYRIDY